MVIASLAKAGVWGSQPVIGLMGDYNTNPALLDLPNTEESHANLLLDAPTSYVGNAYKFSILPSFRYSSAQGYSYVDSNYEHLTLINELDTDRGSVTMTGAAARDSSLYHDYLLNGSKGVRRDTVSGDLNWDRQLTERVDLDGDASWTRVQFGQSVGTATLTNYKYASLTPTLAWAESELSKLTMSASAGRYNSLNGLTESTNFNLQAGFAKKLTEIWSLTAAAGYSRADNRADGFQEALEFTPQGPVIVLIPYTLKTTQNGSVYNLTLNRQTSLLSLTAVASRQLTPTGFAFLSRQDLYQLKAAYNATERWTYSGEAHRINYVQPQSGNISSTNLDVTSVTMSAAWQWTEHWTATFTASHVMEHYVSPSLGIHSSGVSIEISRQFNWKSFQ